MADIYLTKVERKTIFTQGLIYVLFTFVISDLTVMVPQVACVFPWLFILGVLGVNKFYHPVLTVSLSTITTFISSLFKYNGLNIGCITSSLIAFLVTSSGIIVGICIKDFVLEHRLVKHLSVNKKVLNILLIVLVTLGAFTIYIYKYGNIFTYMKSSKKVEEYIELNNIENCAVESLKYIEFSFNEYICTVKAGDLDVVLKVAENISILNKEEYMEIMEKELNVNSRICNVSLSYEDTDSILPNKIVATISVANVSSDEIALKALAQEITDILQFTDKYNNAIEKCILNINKSVEVLERKDFNSITYEYLINSLKEETIN